ncbi:MAG: hypothetical protein Q8L48_18305 [Archangium sp.]|nr:hypothetical protein [Archangium sp.]
MIFSLLLISVLQAPRAPAEAEVVAWVPKLEQVNQLLPFFTAAGSRSVLLRPEAWRADAHPLIDVDVTSRPALALVGIDPGAGLTSSRLGDASIACVTVSDAEKYRKAADAKLARLGEVFEKVEAGVSVYATRDPLGRVLAAYVLHGRESCAISGHGRSVETSFPMLSRIVTKPAQGPGFVLAAKVPGVVQVIAPGGSQHGVLSLNAKDLALTVDGRSKGLPLAQLAGAGASPLGAFSTPGMAVIRARVAKAQVLNLVEQAVRQFPGSATLLPLAREAAPSFTGNAAVLVSHARVTSGLRTREARFFALRSALLVEVSDAVAVAALLAKLDPKALAFREGSLSVTLEGMVLVVANDAEVRARAVAALAKAAGKQGHGVEFEVDPKLVAKGLQQVPLLEAVQAPELAGLVAAGTELGPLLLASERVSGFLDSAGGGAHSGRVVWQLDEEKFVGDAGVR